MIKRKMLIFLMLKIILVLSASELNLSLSSQPYGMIKLLESIMDNEMLEMMIMEMQALKPPKNTIADTAIFPNFCGIRIG